MIDGEVEWDLHQLAHLSSSELGGDVSHVRQGGANCVRELDVTESEDPERGRIREATLVDDELHECASRHAGVA